MTAQDTKQVSTKTRHGIWTVFLDCNAINLKISNRKITEKQKFRNFKWFLQAKTVLEKISEVFKWLIRKEDEN